jgi:hypothetical protein
MGLQHAGIIHGCYDGTTLTLKVSKLWNSFERNVDRSMGAIHSAFLGYSCYDRAADGVVDGFGLGCQCHCFLPMI